MEESGLPGKASTVPDVAPRRRWIAGLLSFLVIGLGQVYDGRWRRGLCLYLLGWPLVFVACVSFLWPVGWWVPLSLLGLVAVFKVFVICDAIALATRATVPFRLRPYNRWYVYGAIWVGAVFAADGALALIHLRVQSYYIPSGSMKPALLPGDRLVVDMLDLRQRAPRRGEIVVFQSKEDPRLQVVERVVALPGDLVTIVDKQLYLSGKRVDDSAYAIHSDPNLLTSLFSQLAARDKFGPLVVPPGTVFCLGDNRDNSWDSRFWGPLPRANILGGGRLRIYWSSNPGGSIRWQRIGSFVH